MATCDDLTLHARVKAFEAECLDARTRVQSAVRAAETASFCDPLEDLGARLGSCRGALDELESRMQVHSELSRSMQHADKLANEISARLGLPSLDVQLRELREQRQAEKAEKAEKTEVENQSLPEQTVAWSPSSAQRDPAYSSLIGKYAGGVENLGIDVHQEFASKYAVGAGVLGNDVTAAETATANAATNPATTSADMEETTMELKSQLIFSALNRNPGQRWTRPAAIPEPVKELADLPALPKGPTPRKAEETIDDARLEDAISLALAKSCDVGEGGRRPEANPPAAATASNNTAVTTPAAGMFAAAKATTSNSSKPSNSGHLRSSSGALGMAALTPKVPTSLAEWRAVDEDAFNRLPSFVRGQITLDELNASSAAIHRMVAGRLERGEGSVVFGYSDVDELGLGKVVLNALGKVGMVKVKVVYGEGTVYFFACDEN